MDIYFDLSLTEEEFDTLYDMLIEQEDWLADTFPEELAFSPIVSILNKMAGV